MSFLFRSHWFRGLSFQNQLSFCKIIFGRSFFSPIWYPNSSLFHSWFNITNSSSYCFASLESPCFGILMFHWSLSLWSNVDRISLTFFEGSRCANWKACWCLFQSLNIMLPYMAALIIQSYCIVWFWCSYWCCPTWRFCVALQKKPVRVLPILTRMSLSSPPSDVLMLPT